MSDNEQLTYAKAGVDIEAGNELVQRIKPFAKQTHRPEVMTGLGGFGGLFALPIDKYQQPVLVSGTDGVGTKLKLAIESNMHQHIGIDLVAMCVNDIVVSGAEPLFFLDYYATSSLDIETATAVIASIADGCQQAGCALMGGETAEMPGMYQPKDYDLAGFCVGIVERDAIIDGSHVQPGDQLIALASSGPHANGYSLIRKILAKSNAPLDTPIENRTLQDYLLTPTRIYVKNLLEFYSQCSVKSVAHITGGGITENLPRVLPDHCSALVEQSSWEWPAIFNWLQTQGNVSNEEMLKTFNCGVGMIIVVSKDDLNPAIDSLTSLGETAWRLGEIQARQSSAVVYQS